MEGITTDYMPKIIDNTLLDSIRKPGEMVDEMLDKQVEDLERSLGGRAKGLGNRLLSIFVQNGNRLQLTERDVATELESTMGFSAETTRQILEAFLRGGILHRTAGDRYEIANNFLARRAFQKVEAENRVLRTIRATIQDRMSREELLDNKYLNYIATSLPLLNLSNEELAFVKKSQEAVRRRRRAIAIFRTLVFVLLAGMAIWTYNNYQRAEKNNRLLQELNLELNTKKREAELAREEAFKQKGMADSLRDLAVEQKNRAEANEASAIWERNIADSLRRRALADRDSIQSLRQKAVMQAEALAGLNEKLRQEAQRSEALRLEAEQNEQIAQEARKKAEDINRVITSWNAASRVLQIEDPRTKALVALEAFHINNDPSVSGGNIYHPNVIKALLDAAQSLDETLTFREEGRHLGAVRDILVHPRNKNIFYTTGSDGTVLEWELAYWNALGKPQIKQVQPFQAKGGAVHNRLAISPDANRLLVAGELPELQLLNTKNRQLAGVISLPQADEIFAGALDDKGNILAAGFNAFYRYEPVGKRLMYFPKNRSRVNLVLTDENTLQAYSLAGRRDEDNPRYLLQFDSLADSRIGRGEIGLPGLKGSPQEIDYGELSAMAYQVVNQNLALVVLGFTNGRILVMETLPGGDRFLPLSGDARKAFKPHQAFISDIVFSHDGHHFAVASYDGTVSVWDLRRYNEPTYQPVVFDRNAGWVQSVAFSPDDQFLLAGCHEGSVFFWSLDPQNYASFLCDGLRRTQSTAVEQQRKLGAYLKKSLELSFFDQLSTDDYRRYFGESGLTDEERRKVIRVCDF